MISGGITAPVARTVANSTIVTPKRMKDQETTLLTWTAMSIARCR